jgi:deoxyribonuclease II
MFGILTFLIGLFSSSALSCKDENGGNVDSWLIIKSPFGTSYYYGDDNTNLQKSTNDSLNITDSGALAFTSEQIWIADSYVLYNDEPPLSTNYSYTFGHTKGLFFLDNSSGVWLQHSTPEFPYGPSITPNYIGLHQNAWENGQHFFCVTLKPQELDKIAFGFLYNRPLIYDFKLSYDIQQNYGNITALTQNKYNTDPNCISATVNSLGGAQYTVFSKNTEWNNDLYSNCIEDYYNTNLLVQSWVHSDGLGPSCPWFGKTVLDVKNMYFSADFSWSAWNDHSKWAADTAYDILCFSDINRVSDQFKRGGGAICKKDSMFYKTIYSAIQNTDSC